MNIERIFSFLVLPGSKLEEQPEISGAEIALRGRLFGMLRNVFDRSDRECDIEICFTASPDGEQENACRSDLLRFLGEQTIDNGLAVAQRLQQVTTNRSGLGLLFLICGRNDEHRKILVSRFPADHGILAEERRRGLRVEFLEKVFMRNAKSYKAVTYTGSSLQSDFWDGKAVDRQAHDKTTEVSTYWIEGFLQSVFKTTPALGTRRLADAMRKAVTATGDLAVKEEIVAATRLAHSFEGTNTSIQEFARRLGLSDTTQAAIVQELTRPELAHDRFVFASDVFSERIPYRSVELDNGALMTASAETFEDCFDRTETAEAGRYIYSTEGRITDQRLRGSK